MTAAWNMTKTELKLFLRDPMAMFFTLLFPLMMLFLFGSIFGNEPDPGLGGRGRRRLGPRLPRRLIAHQRHHGAANQPGHLPGRRSPAPVPGDPLRPSVVLGAQVAVGLNVRRVSSALLGSGLIFFGLHLPENPGILLVAILLSAASIFAFGFILASVLPNARTAQSVAMVVFFPMMFLSGAALPRPLLSETIQDVAQALPLTHVVTLLDDAWSGAGWNPAAMLVLVGVLVAGVTLSARLFRWE